MEIKAVQLSNVCPSIFVTFSGIVIEDSKSIYKQLLLNTL